MLSYCQTRFSLSTSFLDFSLVPQPILKFLKGLYFLSPDDDQNDPTFVVLSLELREQTKSCHGSSTTQFAILGEEGNFFWKCHSSGMTLGPTSQAHFFGIKNNYLINARLNLRFWALYFRIVDLKFLCGNSLVFLVIFQYGVLSYIVSLLRI